MVSNSQFFWRLLEFKELLGKGLTLDSRCGFSLDTMSRLSASCRKLIPNHNKDMPGWLVIEPPMDTVLSCCSVGIRKRLENIFQLSGNREGIPGLLGEFNIHTTTVGWGLGLGSDLRLASVQTVVFLFDKYLCVYVFVSLCVVCLHVCLCVCVTFAMAA